MTTKFAVLVSGFVKETNPDTDSRRYVRVASTHLTKTEAHNAAAKLRRRAQYKHYRQVNKIQIHIDTYEEQDMALSAQQYIEKAFAALDDQKPNEGLAKAYLRLAADQIRSAGSH